MPPKKNILTLLKDREYGGNTSRKIRQILNTEQFNIDFPQPIQNVAPPVIIPEPQAVIEIPPPSPPPIDRRNVGGRKTMGRGGGRGGRG
jgi:hypothetical protein